jgi:hypothetical protein
MKKVSQPAKRLLLQDGNVKELKMTTPEKREATKNEARAADAYNKTLTDSLKKGKKTPTSDYLNLETYSPIGKDKTIDIEQAGKALDESDAEMLRETRRGDTKPPSTMEKIRSAVGLAKGGKVSSASSRADGIAQRGKTKGRMC